MISGRAITALFGLIVPLAAKAQPAKPLVTLPLSQYGSLSALKLQAKDLQGPVRKNVDAAIAVAAEASTKALEAEAVMQAAERAARTGHENLKLSFDHCRYRGEIANGRASGLGVMVCASGGFKGRFRDGRLDGLGGDYSSKTADAYEGAYENGQRMDLGVERDGDGFYPGRYGFYVDPKDPSRRVDMELLGTQDFRGSHWAGTYGSYAGPKIACTLIKGAVLEGSVLDGPGAKFDAGGKVTEQGLYNVGILKNGAGPPC